PQAVKTGNRTSGSAVITGIASTAGLEPGMFVRGTGIPAGTKILTVDSGSQITLDANATSGSGTSTSLTIDLIKIRVKVKGRLQGAGGAGGAGGNSNPDQNGQAGGMGGTALKARYGNDLILDE